MVDKREYWYIECKVCGNLHREAEPADIQPGFNVKVARVIECPDNPGQFAEYSSTDWMLLNESGKKEFLARNRPEQENK